MSNLCYEKEFCTLKDIFINFVYNTWSRKELKCHYELRDEYNTPILTGKGIIDCFNNDIKLILPFVSPTKELYDKIVLSEIPNNKYSLFLDDIPNIFNTNGQCDIIYEDIEIVMRQVQLESFSFTDVILDIDNNYIKINPMYEYGENVGIEISAKKRRVCNKMFEIIELEKGEFLGRGDVGTKIHETEKELNIYDVICWNDSFYNVVCKHESQIGVRKIIPLDKGELINQDYMKCPFCGYEYDDNDLWEYDEGTTNCSNCGAELEYERQVEVIYNIELKNKPHIIRLD